MKSLSEVKRDRICLGENTSVSNKFEGKLIGLMRYLGVSLDSLSYQELESIDLEKFECSIIRLVLEKGGIDPTFFKVMEDYDENYHTGVRYYSYDIEINTKIPITIDAVSLDTFDLLSDLQIKYQEAKKKLETIKTKYFPI